jgi:hypothetical protein
MTTVTWLRPEDPSDFVHVVLQLEAPDIPAAKLDGPWIQRVVPAEQLAVNEAMVAEHDATPEHQQRRDGFVNSFRTGVPVLPLIALGAERYLVDGYARIRAARLVGLRDVEALVQDLDCAAAH